MLTEPAELLVTCTEQFPELRVHVDEENVTVVEPLCVKLTVPVGFDPVTCTVHVDEDPAVTGLGEQVRLVEVGRIVE